MNLFPYNLSEYLANIKGTVYSFGFQTYFWNIHANQWVLVKKLNTGEKISHVLPYYQDNCVKYKSCRTLLK